MARWTPKATIQFANDLITASLVLDEDSETRAAFQAMADALISAALAADPTLAANVTQIASEKVDEAIVDRDLIDKSYAGLPSPEEPELFVVVSKNGGRPFVVTANDILVGATQLLPAKDWGVWTSNGGAMIWADPTPGAIHIPNLHVDKINDQPYSQGAVNRIIQVDVAISQSKGLGRALPIGARLDPTDPRIQMYDWSTGAITTATTPLSAPVTATGLSPVMPFARELLRRQPPGVMIVIVNAGVGDTSVVADRVNGVWRHDYTGPRPKLWEQAMTASQAVHDRLVAQYGITPEHILFSDQGEADDVTARSEYEAALDATVGDYRTRFGASSTALFAGMVTEWVNSGENAAVKQGIRLARLDAPRRLTLAGAVDGIPNSGGSNRVGTSGTAADGVHAGREGIEITGVLMADAYEYALTNTTEATRYAMTPQRVSALRIGTTLQMEWSQSFGRVTSYSPEYRYIGDTAWTAIPCTEIDRRVTFTLPTAAPVEVRVTAVNANGPSLASTPVYARGV